MIYAWTESRDYGNFSVKIQGLLTKKRKKACDPSASLGEAKPLCVE